MSRQAHMELAMANNLSVGLGDTIYYVNNGTRKSHGDVQKKKDEVVINCYHVDEKDIEKTLTSWVSIMSLVILPPLINELNLYWLFFLLKYEMKF